MAENPFPEAPPAQVRVLLYRYSMTGLGSLPGTWWRRELVGDMSSREHEALRSTTGTNLSNLPIHMADMGTDNYEQEFTLGLVEKDRNLLREINTALAKIQDGTYGLCEGTGKPISKPRLEAQPWAKYSIEYARQLEKGGVRR